MAHFAHVNSNTDVVCSVIVIEQDVISGAGGWPCPHCNNFVVPADWVQTSYNTNKGIHKLGGTPLRKNYAGVGYKYDKQLDAFIPPQPFPSWKLNKVTGTWDAPKPEPDAISGSSVVWDEENQDWKQEVATCRIDNTQ